MFRSNFAQTRWLCALYVHTLIALKVTVNKDLLTIALMANKAMLILIEEELVFWHWLKMFLT